MCPRSIIQGWNRVHRFRSSPGSRHKCFCSRLRVARKTFSSKSGAVRQAIGRYSNISQHLCSSIYPLLHLANTDWCHLLMGFYVLKPRYNYDRCCSGGGAWEISPTWGSLTCTYIIQCMRLNIFPPSKCSLHGRNSVALPSDQQPSAITATPVWQNI